MPTLNIPAVKTAQAVVCFKGRTSIAGSDFKLTEKQRAAIEAAFAGSDTAAIIKEVELHADTMWAYHAGSAQVGDCVLEHEGRTLKVSRLVEIKAAEILPVADVKAAQEIMKGRTGAPVSAQEGGKRARWLKSGGLITCGTAAGFGFTDEQIAASMPVAAFLVSQRGARLAVVVADGQE